MYTVGICAGNQHLFDLEGHQNKGGSSLAGVCSLAYLDTLLLKICIFRKLPMDCGKNIESMGANWHPYSQNSGEAPAR